MSGDEELIPEPPDGNDEPSDEDGMGPKSPVRGSVRSLLLRRDSGAGGGSLSARNTGPASLSASPVPAQKKKRASSAGAARASRVVIGFGAATVGGKIPAKYESAVKGPPKKGPAIEITEDYTSTPITAAKPRSVGPGNAHADREQLAAELISLKKKLQELEGDRLIMRARVLKAEGDAKKNEKCLQDFLEKMKGGPTAQVTMLAGRLQQEIASNRALTNRVRELEELSEKREAELNVMRSEADYLKMVELKEEAKTYYTEVRRLQALLAKAEAGGAAVTFLEKQLAKSQEEVRRLEATVKDMEENGLAMDEATRKAREEARARKKEEREFRKAAKLAVVRIQRAWRKRAARRRTGAAAAGRRNDDGALGQAVEMQSKHYAAVAIQAFVRAALARLQTRELYAAELRKRERAMVATVPETTKKTLLEEDDGAFDEDLARGEESAPNMAPEELGRDPNLAATSIQRVYRGFRTRAERKQAPRPAGLTPEQIGQYNAAEVLCAVLRRRLAMRRVMKIRADHTARRAANGSRDSAARDIQRWWRWHLLRRRASRNVRTRKMEEKLNRKRESEKEAQQHAASAIQRAWKSRRIRRAVLLESVMAKKAKQRAIEEERLAVSATLISRVARGWRARVAVRRLRQVIAAKRAERIAREEEVESLPEVEDDAGPPRSPDEPGAIRLLYKY